MIEHFLSLGDNFRQLVAVMMYHLPRTVAFMVFFPLFTRGFGGMFMKMSVGSVLILYPAYAAMEVYRTDVVATSLTFMTFVSEVALGTLLGLTIALPYFAFKGFGALVDVYRGATFSAQTTGADSGEELPIEQLFGLLFVALILAGPGLHALTTHLLNSYLLLPPGTFEFQSAHLWYETLIRLVADQITFSVLLSAPVLIAVLVLEILLEIVSAFTQQLQVYSLQFSVKSLLGVAMLLLMLSFAEEEIFRLFKQYSDTLNQLLGVPL